MNALVAELVEVEAREGSVSGAEDAPEDDGDRAAAGMLLAEIMQAAALTVVVASLFNALEAGRAPPAALSAVRNFMPKRSIVFDAALARLVADPFSAPSVHQVQNYCHALDLAERLSRPELLIGDDVYGPAPIETAAGAWRALCTTTRATALALADRARSEAMAGRSTGLRTLRQLADAASGGVPALHPTGALNLPDWAERRRAPRHANSEMAALGWQGRMHEALILDLSDTGARVQTAIEIPPGERVSLVRQSVPARTAIVRWQADGRLGLEYATLSGVAA